MGNKIELSIYGKEISGLTDKDPSTQKDSISSLSFSYDMSANDYTFSEENLKGGSKLTLRSFNVKKELFSPNSIDVTLYCAHTNNRSLTFIDKLKNLLAKSTVNLKYNDTSYILQNYFVFSAKVEKYTDTDFTLSFTAYSADKLLTLPTTNQSYTNRCITDIAYYFVHTKYQKDLTTVFDSYGSANNNLSLQKLLINNLDNDNKVKNLNKNKFQHLSKRDTETDTEKIGDYHIDRFHPTLIQSRESAYDFLSRVCYENGEYFFYEDGQMRFGSGNYNDNLTTTLSIGSMSLTDVGITDFTGDFEEESPELFANSAYINFAGGKWEVEEKTITLKKDVWKMDESGEPGPEDKKITIYFDDVAKKYMTGDSLELKPHMHIPEQDSPIEKYKVFDDRIEIYDYDETKLNNSDELHIRMRFDATGDWDNDGEMYVPSGNGYIDDHLNETYWSMKCDLPNGLIAVDVDLEGEEEEPTKKQKHGFNPSKYIYRYTQEEYEKQGKKPYLQIDLILKGQINPKPKYKREEEEEQITVVTEDVDPSDSTRNILFKSGEKSTSIEAASITAGTEKAFFTTKEASLNIGQKYSAWLANIYYTAGLMWVPRISRFLGNYRWTSAILGLVVELGVVFAKLIAIAYIGGKDAAGNAFDDRKKHQKAQYNTEKNYKNLTTYSDIKDNTSSADDFISPNSASNSSADKVNSTPDHENESKPKSPITDKLTPENAFNANKEAHEKLVTLKATNQYWHIPLGAYFLYRQIFKDYYTERGIFCANSINFVYDGNGFSMTIKAVRRAKATLTDNTFQKDADIEIPESQWCPGIIPPFLSVGSGENGLTNDRRILPYGQNQFVNNTIRLATVSATYGEDEITVNKTDGNTADVKRDLAPLGQKYNIVEGDLTSDKTKYDPAKCLANTDPLAIGRVRVIFDDDEQRIPSELMPVAKPSNGFYFTPRVGDRVLVAYAYGNPNKPFVLCDMDGVNKMGSFYSERNVIQSRNGHKIQFEDPIVGSGWGDLIASFLPIPLVSDAVSNSITSSIGTQDPLWTWKRGGMTLTDGLGIYSIKMDSGNRSININSPLGNISMGSLTGIKISAPKGDIDIEGYNISLKAGNNLTLSSGEAIAGEIIQDLTKAGIGLAVVSINQLLIDFSAYRFLFRLIFQPVEGSISITSPRNILISNGKKLDFKDVSELKAGRNIEKVREKLNDITTCLSMKNAINEILSKHQKQICEIHTQAKKIVLNFKNNGGEFLKGDFWNGIIDEGKIKIEALNEALNYNGELIKKLCNLRDFNDDKLFTETVNDTGKQWVRGLAVSALKELEEMDFRLITTTLDVNFVRNNFFAGSTKFDKAFEDDAAKNSFTNSIIKLYTKKGFILNDKNPEKIPIEGEEYQLFDSKHDYEFSQIQDVTYKNLEEFIKDTFNLSDSNCKDIKEKLQKQLGKTAKTNKKYLIALLKLACNKPSGEDMLKTITGFTDIAQMIGRGADDQNDWRINQGFFGIYSDIFKDENKKFTNKLKPRIYMGTGDYTCYLENNRWEKDENSRQSRINKIADIINNLPDEDFE